MTEINLNDLADISVATERMSKHRSAAELN